MSSEVVTAVKTFFGLEASKIRSLGSCQDINFKLSCADGRSFVVKYTNASVSEADVQFQHSVTQYLHSIPLGGEIGFPKPAPRCDDPNSTTVQQTLDGKPYTLHVLSYVKGNLFSDFSYYHEDCLADFGSQIAKLSAALKAYPGPTRPRKSEWDLRLATELCNSHVDAIADPAERARWMDRAHALDSKIRAHAHDLRVQLVHGDLAPYNVLADVLPNGRTRVKGVIDFGDITETWLVGELAIATVPFFAIQSRRALDYVHHIVRGFASVTPLTAGEASALWPMIVLRTIALYISVEGLFHQDPQNDYLQKETVANKQAALFVVSIPFEVGVTAVMQAAGLPYVPPFCSIPRQLSSSLLHPPQRLLSPVDLSSTSDWYQPGEWLDLDRCLDRLEASACGTVTYCGQPWLCATSLRQLREPGTIATFSLLRVDPRTEIRAPAGCIAHTFQAATEWPDCPSLLAKRLGDGRECVFDTWTLRIVPLNSSAASSTAAAAVTTPAEEGEKKAAGSVLLSDASLYLLQALARDTTTFLPLRSVPLLVTPADWKLYHSAVLDPTSLLREASPLLLTPSAPPSIATACDQVLTLRQSHVAACQEHYYRHPQQIERAYRTFMYDTAGRAYLDLVNNVAVVGHCHEEVTKAMTQQAQLLNTNSRFVYHQLTDYAEAILRHIPEKLRSQGKLNRVFFVNSGSEATDLALRLGRTVASERQARGQGQAYASQINRNTLCMQGGYHGVTTASDEVSTTLNDNPRSLETRAPWIHLLPMPNLYRGRYRLPSSFFPHPSPSLAKEDSEADNSSNSQETLPSIVQQYVEEVRVKIEALQSQGITPAVFIAEPLSGNAGGVEIPPGYLSQVYDLVRQAGGLCISDEVQVGYGRLGRSFWGFEEHDVVPDILTMAKAAGNGHPLGFVITSDEIVREFHASQGSFFSSAGGGPVSCAVGKKVLEVIEHDNLQANAAEVGDYLFHRLQDCQRKHPDRIGAIHGHGLYQGIELVRHGSRTDGQVPEPATAEAYAICERLLELGVITHNTGDYSNVLKAKPPLYFSKEDVDFFVEALDLALQGW